MSHDEGSNLSGRAGAALDVAIDRALRELMRVDPPERLTTDVMARIAEGGPTGLRQGYGGPPKRHAKVENLRHRSGGLDHGGEGMPDRTERHDSGSPRWSGAWWPAVAGLAAALLLLALALRAPRTADVDRVATRSGPATTGDARPGFRVADATQNPPRVSGPANAAPAIRSDAAGGAHTPRRDAGTRAPRVSEPEVAALEPSIAIAPLDPLEPIAIESIAPAHVPLHALDIPEIEIAPIEMTGRPEGRP